MIDAVGVGNQSVGQSAQVKQSVPIRIVSGQAANFETEQDADLPEGHFRRHTREPTAPVGGGTRQAEILVDNGDLVGMPTEVAGAIGEGVLAPGRLAIVLDLGRRGLANVDETELPPDFTLMFAPSV